MPLTHWEVEVTGNSYRDQFLLEPGRVHLNHGSFGAVPRPVLEAYQEWQRRIEANPNRFMFHELEGHLQTSREALAGYLGTSADNLVFVPNATFGMNFVARGLGLQAGDEVLTSNHEYGAVERLWHFVAQKTGAVIKFHHLPEPLTTEARFVEAFWQGVTERTKVISLSHITAPTGLIFPLAEVCRRARQAGILTLIDGAHAPGQIDLSLDTLGADFYTGNGHKWLCTPRGAAFLYAHPEVQSRLEPLIVSWGYDSPTASGKTFQDYFSWIGTSDPSPYLAVADAVAFQRNIDPALLDAQHRLAVDAWQELQALFGEAPLAEPPEYWLARMAAVGLPADIDRAQWMERLSNEHQIEVIIREWEGRSLLRISLQVYNDRNDLDRLLSALQKLRQG